MTDKKSEEDDQLLKIERVGARIVISIGANTLAEAVKLSPEFQHYDEEAGEYVNANIPDPIYFADEVVGALQAEEEDGTTLIHMALDRAIVEMVENGATSIVFPWEKD